MSYTFFDEETNPLVAWSEEEEAYLMKEPILSVTEKEDGEVEVEVVDQEFRMLPKAEILQAFSSLLDELSEDSEGKYESFEMEDEFNHVEYTIYVNAEEKKLELSIQYARDISPLEYVLYSGGYDAATGDIETYEALVEDAPLDYESDLLAMILAHSLFQEKNVSPL